MPMSGLATRARARDDRSLRRVSAWLLCGLVIIFCANAKQSRYFSEDVTSHLAASQALSESVTAGLGMALAGLLLLWSTTRVPARIAIPAVRPERKWAPTRLESAGRLDCEMHLRAPPRG